MNIILKGNMNSLRRNILLSGILVLTAFLPLKAAITKDFYASSSVLANGSWVKIGVEETGVYEISYEALRQMGFSNPASVSVYGRGGRMLPESFVTNSGVPVITDDLTPVKVIHENNKLYFYGLGPEEVTFESSSDFSTGGYFSRKSNNIYSKRGYYFLTDSKPATSMTVKNYTSSAAKKLEKGLSYVYHELDSVQNTTLSGQLFWGERVGLPEMKRRKWSVSLPDALPGNKGVMECEIYFPDREFGSGAYVAYGFENTQGFFKTPYVQATNLFYAPHQPAVAQVEVPGSNGSVFVEFDGNDMGDFSNLDFWVVSYERALPTMKGSQGENINQQLLAFPELEKNATGQIELQNSASYIVLDVTSATDPQRLTINQQGSKGVVGVKNNNKTPVIVVFDTDMQQNQISGYEMAYQKIENQNLHSYKDKGADFIIITTPTFKPYAEEIAELHRKYDGIQVVVATTEECYNEFSGGVPDAMAYRSFAKMLYLSPRPPKNMLLLGPLYADFRGLKNEHDPAEGIIAYQSPTISTSRGAHNINDFYGMMSDKFRTDYYERNDVNIGVGILPVKFETEARTVVDKIEAFLKRDDHAYYLNKYTAIGGLLDAHTHDIQVRDINNHIRLLDNTGTIFTPLSIDSYGNSEAQKKFFSRLNEGCLMFSYFGHGAEQFIGKDRNFFNAGDVYKLRNQVLPLALFGGCQITNTDRGFRGLGETLVTGTPYGCIGTIVSARDTWSGQNYEFFKQFFTCLYTSGSSTSSPRRTSPVTIGEVYANVKHYSTYNNELAYQLLCDPALVIPSIIGSVKVKSEMPGGAVLIPGEKFKMSGNILNANGENDNKFNGELVLRLNEPEKTIAAGCIETGEDPGTLSYTYRDSQISMTAVKVVNGAFEVEIHVPASVASFAGDDALLYFSAYDPSTKIGAAKCFKVSVGGAQSSSSELSDKVPPVIENFEFDSDACSINFTASDNVALNLSDSPLNKGVFLYIDGKEFSDAHFVEAKIDTERNAISKNILIDYLSYGEHSARLKVKDCAGNFTENEIIFTYEPKRAKYALRRVDSSNADCTRIEFESVYPTKGTLVVIASNGAEIWRGSFTDGFIEWNHVDLDGNPVAPGHYKAYMIETGTDVQKGHSDTIDIPVI